jgi:DNA-binding transcriptional ArsR family regulator
MHFIHLDHFNTRSRTNGINEFAMHLDPVVDGYMAAFQKPANGSEAESLSNTFAALADPTRRAIIARLALGETSVKELADPFQMSLPAVTKHLKVLQRAGLITQSRQAQWRPCRLEAAPLQGVADYLEPYRQFWEQRFDQLDNYLKTLKLEANQS